ncbi:MAG: hypothetical protein PHW10_00405 [Candidatus Peribacteraceae bacterium]|nr:hypothetical protein [Candidatus Peribacteraceae bacterium]
MNTITLSTSSGDAFGAYGTLGNFYEESLAAIPDNRRPARQNDPVEVLDFGTGENGVSRIIFQSILTNRGRLALFDKPDVPIHFPRDAHVRIAQAHEVYGYPMPPFDLVNLSYVLCCLGNEDPALTLLLLQEYHRRALFSVVDYTMRGRSREETLALLNSASERRWQKRMGEDAFVAARTRHTADSLRSLLEDASFDIMQQESLDSLGLRTAFLLQSRA